MAVVAYILHLHIRTNEKREDACYQSVNVACQRASVIRECSLFISRFVFEYSNYLKMLSRQFIRNAQLCTTARWFTHSSVKRETNKMDKIPTQKSAENVKDTAGVIGTRMHRVTDFDKRLLVWVKRYPRFADVPNDVTVECLLTARSKARIKACNYMIVATLIGCIISVITGKRQAARGETLIKQRDDWFNEMMAKDKNK